MSLLTLRALGVTLSAPLFSNLSLTISKGDRLGLIAANGRGKSTLLGVLAGETEPTSGDITRARGQRVGYVRQDLPRFAPDQTFYDWVLAALPADQADYESWRVDVALNDLSVPYELQHQPLATLSGGWQRTAMLAARWITEPDVLLLDEPTNHLDLSRIGLLQGWLAALPRDLPVIITSHDRAFLDATTNRTLFLRADTSAAFPLPYSAARAALDEADAAEERRFANDLNKARQLRKQASKLKNIGTNSGSELLLNKTKQLTDRAQQIEEAAKPAHRESSAGDIRLGNSGSHARSLITLSDLNIETPDGRLLYRTGLKWISPGDRVVLLGGNGTGKTTLVQRVARALQGHDSPVKCAASVMPGYSDQHLSHLNHDQSPMSAVTEAFDIGDQRARTLLAGAGIDIRMQDGPIRSLSGGQKARLAMLILRLKGPNFYVLDEPTNHLDIDGQEALESELTAHGAACLLVSHDRSFLRNVGNRFWVINRKRLEEVDSPDAFLPGEMSPA